MPDLALRELALFKIGKKKDNAKAKTKRASKRKGKREGKGKKKREKKKKRKREKKKKGKKEKKKKRKEEKKKKKKKKGKRGKAGAILEVSYNFKKFKLFFEMKKGKFKKLLRIITLYSIAAYILYNLENKIVMLKINKFKIFVAFL